MHSSSWSSLLGACSIVGCAVVIAPLACSSSDDPASPATASTTEGTGGGDPGAGGAGGKGGGVDLGEVQARLQTTLEDLAALGQKRAGSEGGLAAGDYVKKRFEDAGIADVTFETFDFQAFAFNSSSLEVTLDGAAIAMVSDVFEYSGAGHVDADIVDLGKGHEEDYDGKDVTGKIVLVVRDPTFHRQAQYQLVAAHGGAAMLYVSQSPDNLIQIGTVADPEDGLATVPTVTVGKDDGQKIIDALGAGQSAHAVIDVDASLVPATGRNVVARIPGTDPSGAYVVVGAHYDTWYVGSTDNGTGVAALVEIAEQAAQQSERRLGLVLVGYDGEELGLFGGYDFLRRHVIADGEPMLAFVNLEMPGAGEQGTGLRAMAITHEGPIDPAAKETEAHKVYTTYVGMEIVPAQFGGLIPTDIQGMYWYGLQGATTYCETPYYHTTEDTPDKVDAAFLANGTTHIVEMLAVLDQAPVASFDKLDTQLWNPDIDTTPDASGKVLVEVTAKDAGGTTQAAAEVRVWVDVDDFTRVFDAHVVADGEGKASVEVPADVLAMGKGKRWLHVTAGATYPLSERIFSLP